MPEILCEDRGELVLFFDLIPHGNGGSEKNDRYMLSARGFGKNGLEAGSVPAENMCVFHEKISFCKCSYLSLYRFSIREDGRENNGCGEKGRKKGAVPITENLLSGNQMCYNHVSCKLKKDFMEEKAANYGYHGQSREKDDPVKRFLVY